MAKRYYPGSGKRRYSKRRSGFLGYLSRMRIADMLILALIGIAGISWAGKKLGMTDESAPFGLTSAGSSDVYYRYCKDARAAGAAPLYRGDPGYRPALDADNDGVACETYRGH
ncbi:excalibur calcium-binding domain-containing protein [Qipengyuania sp. G39]|uniref:Excalibur calcium-binding domain-containing protein n=1 Tax=Qipengyuania profundimaris TaxID=3067652 RepID=A0ABT9HM76_9SPHN|nr:excalibur calcium-binding domain-containing protein [Qipengyuania sp. G39]MDP4574100.1 excalibur calcium-binding domain-containing protein [Qipengyuania sp. G39]